MKTLLLKISRLFNLSQASILISIAVTCLMLPVNIMYIRSAMQVQDSLLQQSSDAISSIQSVYAQDLSSRMSSVDTYMSDLLSDNAYLSVIVRQDGDNDYTFNKWFFIQDTFDQMYLDNTADVFFLYSTRLEDLQVLYLPGTISSDKATVKQWLLDNVSQTFATDWQLLEIGGILYAGHSACQNGLYFGALIDVSAYVADIQGSVLYESTEVLFTDSGEAISADEDSQLIQITTDIPEGNFILISTTLRSEIHSVLPVMQRNALLIALLSLIFIPVLYIVLMFLIIRPLKILGNAMARLQSNPDYRIPSSSQTFMTKEFSALTNSFNEMADHINELRIENYEQQLARAQVELDNMQLIIRPHFLQNTFSLLYTLCLSGQNDALGRFILFLSDYFRYIYQNVNQLTPFSQELPIIRGYLDLASYQYPDSFDIQYDLEEDPEEIMIPPLLILTFVENIMSHARVRGRRLQISLCLRRRSAGTVEFIVSDDGRGMSEETVRRIQAHETIEDHGRIHVGLRNAWQRLDKIYGTDAGMSVESAPDQGTRITVWLPAAPKDDSPQSSPAENADCREVS